MNIRLVCRFKGETYEKENDDDSDGGAADAAISVSQRGYMLGYYDMKNKEVKGIYIDSWPESLIRLLE